MKKEQKKENIKETIWRVDPNILKRKKKQKENIQQQRQKVLMVLHNFKAIAHWRQSVEDSQKITTAQRIEMFPLLVNYTSKILKHLKQFFGESQVSSSIPIYGYKMNIPRH